MVFLNTPYVWFTRTRISKQQRRNCSSSAKRCGYQRTKYIHINEKDGYGNTALFRACWQNHTEILQILLKNDNINVNLRNNYGYSPFLNACETIIAMSVRFS